MILNSIVMNSKNVVRFGLRREQTQDLLLDIASMSSNVKKIICSSLLLCLSI